MHLRYEKLIAQGLKLHLQGFGDRPINSQTKGPVNRSHPRRLV